MVCELFPIASCQRRDQTVAAADRLEVVRAKQEPRIPGCAHLVERDQPGLDEGPLRVGFTFQGGQLRRRVLELASRVGEFAVDRRELLCLDLAVELESSNLFAQGTFA